MKKRLLLGVARAHVWLRVFHGGETRDVCASRRGNRAGQVAFVPAGEVSPLTLAGQLGYRARLVPAVSAEVWKSMVGRHPVPRWVYRGFHSMG